MQQRWAAFGRHIGHRVACCGVWVCLAAAVARADQAPWPMYRGDAGATGVAMAMGPARPVAIQKLSLSIRPQMVAAPGTEMLVATLPHGPHHPECFIRALDPSLSNVQWQVQLPHPPTGMGLRGQTLYVTTEGHSVVAVDLAAKQVVAEADCPDPDGPLEWEREMYPPVVGADGTVFTASATAVNAFSDDLQRRLWTWTSPEHSVPRGLAVLGPPVVMDGGLVLVPHSRGSLFGLSANTGELRWEFRPGQFTMAWALAADQQGRAFWVSSVAPRGHSLFCVNADGEVVWSLALPEGSAAGVAVHGGLVAYLGRHDVLCLRADDGSVVWQAKLPERAGIGGGFCTAPVVDEAANLFAAARGLLMAHNLVTGAELWRLALPDPHDCMSALIIGGGGLLYGTAPPYVFVGSQPE